MSVRDVRLAAIERTCPSHPAQWDGVTADGLRVYVRYRYGVLVVGIGVTAEEAIDVALDAPTHRARVGDEWDGEMSTEDMLRRTGMVLACEGRT